MTVPPLAVVALRISGFSIPEYVHGEAAELVPFGRLLDLQGSGLPTSMPLPAAGPSVEGQDQ
jgi:hypothetical protein